jgi:hypothetical protein
VPCWPENARSPWLDLLADIIVTPMLAKEHARADEHGMKAINQEGRQ